MSSRGPIDADVRRAWTLPSEVYCEERWLERVRERVLARSWQLVGDADRVRTPGQALPVTLLEGSLDEPLLLTRDRDDELHCLSNVCTHRGALVCEAGGVHNVLRCRYHGRRFGLDGRMSVDAGVRRRRELPGAGRRPAAAAARALGQAPLRRSRPGGALRRADLRLRSPRAAGCRSTRRCSTPAARATTWCTPTGRSTATTTSRGSTSPTSTLVSPRRWTTASYRTELFPVVEPAEWRGDRRRATPSTCRRAHPDHGRRIAA